MRKILVPEKLLCPITGELLQEPVIAEDGHTYEKKAIEHWLNQQSTSPLTRAFLPPHLITNWDKKKQLDRFFEKNQLGTAQHFLDVIKTGDLIAIDKLAYLESYLGSVDNMGNTALHWAAYRGFAAVVNLLLAAKANPNAKNNNGETVLHVATIANQLTVIKRVLTANVNVNSKNNYGNTPLHYAASNGLTEAVTLLLAANANLEAQNCFQETPLHQAAYFGRLAVVMNLLENGADCIKVNSDNKTAAQVANDERYLQLANLIEEHQRNVHCELQQAPKKIAELEQIIKAQQDIITQQQSQISRLASQVSALYQLSNTLPKQPESGLKASFFNRV